MKKPLSIILYFTILNLYVEAQDSNFIRIIVPESDTITFAGSAVRFNGCTRPGSEVELNGIPLRVFPTGAFAGYPELHIGENQLVVISKHPEYETVTKNIVVKKTLPEPEKEVVGFAIENVRTIPSSSQKLISGDMIQIQMKATPGCNAFFLTDKRMYELPVTQTSGIRGIYQGTCTLLDADIFPEKPVDFILKNNAGESKTAFSKNTISSNTGEFPAVGITTGTFPYFNYGLGEDRLGGAKICYVDTMVLLTLTGKTGNNYHAKLNESQTVFIPKEYVKLKLRGIFFP